MYSFRPQTYITEHLPGHIWNISHHIYLGSSLLSPLTQTYFTFILKLPVIPPSYTMASKHDSEHLEHGLSITDRSTAVAEVIRAAEAATKKEKQISI